ncbi:MAG: endonuclease/exonuclease/phosphatase family protein [Lachnospiraceae bacterium]|nr:endonuclease/exonuclease/phosphatase family protein [Lachnospiraceae bacterium]
MKIIEWNINHRFGYSNTNMPTWVKKEIQKNADIIVLTETSFKVPNWEIEYKDFFDRREYYVFCSNNTDVGNNEVTIAIKKEFFSIEYVKSFLSEGHKYPDHLEVHCIHKETNKKIVIIGMRIHSVEITDKQKIEEFESVLKSVDCEETVMIVGDFNNNRRGYKNNNGWCLDKVQQLAKKHGFSIYTPAGGSIYENNDGDYSFPEDHILIKGQFLSITKLYDYDRTFVAQDEGVYKWGKNFQKYKGKDQNGKNIYDHICDPFPDHAIIEADFDIK